MPRLSATSATTALRGLAEADLTVGDGTLQVLVLRLGRLVGRLHFGVEGALAFFQGGRREQCLLLNDLVASYAQPIGLALRCLGIDLALCLALAADRVDRRRFLRELRPISMMAIRVPCSSARLSAMPPSAQGTTSASTSHSRFNFDIPRTLFRS